MGNTATEVLTRYSITRTKTRKIRAFTKDSKNRVPVTNFVHGPKLFLSHHSVVKMIQL